MSSEYDAVKAMIEAANRTRQAGDMYAAAMAELLKNRLRACDRIPASTLRTLKRELRDFDIRSGTWRRQ